MKNILSGIMMLVVLGFLSCNEVSLPAVTDNTTNSYSHGMVIWRDLVTVEPESSAKFYSDLFGWEIQRSEGSSPSYFQIRNRGKLIGGIIDFPQKNAVDGNEWLSVMSVSDVQKAAEVVTMNGGQLLVEPTEVAPRGRYAVGVDPSGGIMAVLESPSGDPVREEPGENSWIWTELWTNDIASVQGFYESLGYSISKEKDDDRDYWLLKVDEKNAAAIVRNPMENMRSMWLPYIRVEDPAMMSEKVKRLGGTVVLEPQSNVRQGSIAICLDPFGAPFALQKWPI